jgi:hypothetical protein
MACRGTRPPAALAAALLVFVALLALPTVAEARGPRVCTAAERVPEVEFRALKRFARAAGLRATVAAARTLWHVHATGRLPGCYLTKRAARRRGWWPGASLWRAAPGAAIGGDRFRNREGRLPARFRYVEADLDYRGGRRRGARRLVFAVSTKGRWRIWVTVDHYRTFVRVPAPRVPASR